MNNSKVLLKGISLHKGDLPAPLVERARKKGIAALDIETSGLSWKEDKIATCQVYIPDQQVAIIRVDSSFPYHLGLLLSDPDVCKLFHHAMFDLRFIVYLWSIQVKNIACTKIASKILSPSESSHSLKDLTQHYLGIEIDKNYQRSNWLADDLTPGQLQYAAKDVLYLPELFEVLQRKLKDMDRWQLAEASFDYLPVRVKLDILGSEDVFQY